MELNLCAQCSAFVRRGWDTCHACGEALAWASESSLQGVEVQFNDISEQQRTPAAPVDTNEVALRSEGDDEAGATPTALLAHDDDFDLDPDGSFGATAWKVPDWSEEAQSIAIDPGGQGHESPVLESPVLESPVLESPDEDVPHLRVDAAPEAPTDFIESPPATDEVVEMPAPKVFGAFDDDDDEAVSTLTPTEPERSIAFPFTMESVDSKDGGSTRRVLTLAGLALTVVVLVPLAVVFLLRQPTTVVETPSGIAPAVVAPVSVLPQGWAEFSDERSWFTAALPANPSVALGSDDITVNATTADGDTTVFVYARQLAADRQTALDDGVAKARLDEIALANGTTVKSSSFVTTENNRRLAGRFSNADGTINGDAQVFVEDDRLVALWLITPSPTGSPANFTTLTDNFESTNS